MINNINLQKIAKIGEQSTQGSKQQHVEQQSTASEETIHISRHSNIIQEMVSSGAPRIDENRLMEIKEAIGNGQYKIDYKKLAEALID